MTKLVHLRLLISKGNICSRELKAIVTQIRQTQNSSSSENEGQSKVSIPESLDDLVEPTTCCMSGCTNCVWIEYAEKLSALLKDSDESVQKIIMDKVQDPNMRSFLSMELKLRNLK